MKKWYQGKMLKENKADTKRKNFEKHLGTSVWEKITKGFKQVSWDEFVKNAPK